MASMLKRVQVQPRLHSCAHSLDCQRVLLHVGHPGAEVCSRSGFQVTTQLTHRQGAHLQHGCHSQETRPWSLSQIDHAVDFRSFSSPSNLQTEPKTLHGALTHIFLPSSSSLFWNIVTGGLNTQSLHHVLPSVHHCHYPRCERIALADEF